MAGRNLDRAPLVVGIGGTPRPRSSSERALGVALAAAEDAGARVEMLGASALALPMYAPADGERTANADRLVGSLAEADGLLVATPGYHGGVSGLIKNALDYAEDLRDDPRPYLDGRAVGCIVCAAGNQATTSTLISLRSIVHALRGWPTPLGATINSVPSPAGGDPVVAASATLALIAHQVVAFAMRPPVETQIEATA